MKKYTLDLSCDQVHVLYTAIKTARIALVDLGLAVMSDPGNEEQTDIDGLTFALEQIEEIHALVKPIHTEMLVDCEMYNNGNETLN